MSRVLTSLGACVLLGVIPPGATAQAEPSGPDAARATSVVGSASMAQGLQPDFLFGRPRASLGLRGELVRARAGSDVFDFTTDLLTLEPSDFDATGIAVDLGLPFNSRLDTVIGFAFNRASQGSNYRDFVDADGLEIEQTTALSQVNLSGSLELAVLPRGRSIGQYVWIPSAVTPYVGAGVGLVWYRLEQEGDFVDFVDQSIFRARLESSGWTPGAHMFAGVDVKVARQVLLTGEARYQWADAEMKGDFVGFDPIDLTGLRVSGGVQFVF